MLHLLQKFENRALVVMESETKYWCQLTVDFMTEESDNDDDGNLLVVHQLQWRSKSMCNNFSVCNVELIHANYMHV